MKFFSLAWLQLIHEKRRVVAALAGISFAVLLVLMQLGFQDALYNSATLIHAHLKCDLVLISTQYDYVLSPGTFSQRRLYQTLAFDDVASVNSLYMDLSRWKNPETHRERLIFVMGFDPHANALDLPGVSENLDQIKLPDVVLFDSGSRPEFGPIARLFRKNERIVTEVGDRKIKVGGLFELGTSFAADSNLITSDLNFLRIFKTHKQGLINIGLVTLKPKTNPEKVRVQLVTALPKDVKILTRQEFIDLEKRFWKTTTPIGFIFNLGMLMGLMIGGVIVYQILYTDVSHHLVEYATLKAIGYTNRNLSSVVLQESLILSILGYLPGFVISQVLYTITKNATLLPLHMTLTRVIMVFLLTVLMCSISGILAMRRLQSADPAEVF